MDDLDRHFAIFGDPEVAAYLPAGPFVHKDDSRRMLRTMKDHWWKHGFGAWAVSTVDDKDHVIGFGGISYRQINGKERFNLRFRLDRKEWGKGVAHELGLASFHLAFDMLDADTVHAIVRPDNLTVIDALEKLNMRQTETVNDIADAPASLVYSITAEEAAAVSRA